MLKSGAVCVAMFGSCRVVCAVAGQEMVRTFPLFLGILVDSQEYAARVVLIDRCLYVLGVVVDL